MILRTSTLLPFFSPFRIIPIPKYVLAEIYFQYQFYHLFRIRYHLYSSNFFTLKTYTLFELLRTLDYHKKPKLSTKTNLLEFTRCANKIGFGQNSATKLHAHSASVRTNFNMNLFKIKPKAKITLNNATI